MFMSSKRDRAFCLLGLTVFTNKQHLCTQRSEGEPFHLEISQLRLLYREKSRDAAAHQRFDCFTHFPPPRAQPLPSSPRTKLSLHYNYQFKQINSAVSPPPNTPHGSSLLLSILHTKCCYWSKVVLFLSKCENGIKM